MGTAHASTSELTISSTNVLRFWKPLSRCYRARPQRSICTDDDGSLREQARLGDPTRHDIFRYVADSDEPIDVAELTAHFGLNHNAIRQHLAKLVEAELVEEHAAPAVGGITDGRA